jgi:hypothetical protein
LEFFERLESTLTARVQRLTKAEAPGEGQESGTDRRAEVDAFIKRARQINTKIFKRHIWKLAGYRNATEFERFQRGSRATATATENIGRILRMTPKQFIQALTNKSLLS